MIISRAQLRLQIDRLIDVYGEKPFGDQRENAIWEEIDGMEYSDVIEIVDKFIRESRHSPLPVDFRNAAKLYKRAKKQYSLGEIQPREVAKCLDCGDSGFIRILRKEDFEPWARAVIGSAPCHCARGKSLIEAAARMKPEPVHLGPQFNYQWFNSYEIIPAYQEGSTFTREGL